jgi:hypothetical protein
MGKIDSQLGNFSPILPEIVWAVLLGNKRRFRASGARDRKTVGREAGDCFNLLAEPCSPFFF